MIVSNDSIRSLLTIRRKRHSRHNTSLPTLFPYKNIVFTATANHPMAANDEAAAAAQQQLAPGAVVPLTEGKIASTIPQLAHDAALNVPNVATPTRANYIAGLQLQGHAFEFTNRLHFSDSSSNAQVFKEGAAITPVLAVNTRSQMPLNEPQNSAAVACQTAYLVHITKVIDVSRQPQQGKKRGGKVGEVEEMEKIMKECVNELALLLTPDTVTGWTTRHLKTLRLTFQGFSDITLPCNPRLREVGFIYGKIRVGANGFRVQGNEFEHAVIAFQIQFINDHKKQKVKTDTTNGVWTCLPIAWLNGHFTHIRQHHPLPLIPLAVKDNAAAVTEMQEQLLNNTTRIFGREKHSKEDKYPERYPYDVECRPNVVHALRRYLYEEHGFNAEHLPQASMAPRSWDATVDDTPKPSRKRKKDKDDSNSPYESTRASPAEAH